jgi:hypothetical protein
MLRKNAKITDSELESTVPTLWITRHHSLICGKVTFLELVIKCNIRNILWFLHIMHLGKYLVILENYIADNVIKSLILLIEVVSRSNVIEDTAVAFHWLSHFEHLCASLDSAHPAATEQQLLAPRSKLNKETQLGVKGQHEALLCVTKQVYWIVP